MQFKPHERVMLFIDGATTHKISESLGFQIDYARLLTKVNAYAHLIRAYYYTMVKVEIDHNGEELITLQPLLDYLDYNGYTVVTKDLREGPDNATGKSRQRGSIQTELVVDMVRMAPTYDHAVLFSGDGDFTYAVKHVQDLGRRVTVVSTTQTKPAAIADELKRQADSFVDLATLKNTIQRVR